MSFICFIGQIELFFTCAGASNFVEHLKSKKFNVCAVCLIDSQFITDVTKFISGCMASLSAMVQLELPHVNILSKMDLVTNKKDIEDYLNPEPRALLSELNQRMAPQFLKLNKALIELVVLKGTVFALNLKAVQLSRVHANLNSTPPHPRVTHNAYYVADARLSNADSSSPHCRSLVSLFTQSSASAVALHAIVGRRSPVH
ncbi:GPN-loop GTPase 3-like [Manihot esculenta]|uniref:GPN-loop GTPase 3-like n=1 Tax=Manihot esculenta TaxID=3983 RepID=UPI001CC6F445|nr:GPN-loop GTPase 3-like [Manihot esculenta]